MVVQPTGVAYSFLMECPIPSMKSKKKQGASQRHRETERKEKKYALKEIHIHCKVRDSNSYLHHPMLDYWRSSTWRMH